MEPEIPSDISLDADGKSECGRYIPEPATLAEQGTSVSLYNNLAAICTGTLRTPGAVNALDLLELHPFVRERRLKSHFESRQE